MHKICAREVKTTGMETAGNQWGGTNFRKRFINFKKMLAISKKYGIINLLNQNLGECYENNKRFPNTICITALFNHS